VIFREPVARIISEFNFIRWQAKHPHHELVKAMDLEHFVDSYLVHNIQTKLMCGDHYTDPKVVMKVVKKDFDFWCLSQDADRLIRRLYRRSGKRLQKFRENVTREPGLRTDDIHPDMLQHIRSLNSCDVLLYERLLKIRSWTGLQAHWLTRFAPEFVWRIGSPKGALNDSGRVADEAGARGHAHRA
jgi:hypothetical protein